MGVSQIYEGPDLRTYGWAPGFYESRSPCPYCSGTIMGSKHSCTCYNCALKKYENRNKMTKELKQWNRADWFEYYRNPHKFAEVFADYRNLQEEAKRHTLSSSQTSRLRACEDLIDGKMSS